MKLNLGCGNDYRSGWVNVDSNTNVKCDAVIKLGDHILPINDNSVEEVLMCNSLEHIKDFWRFIDDLYRVCKDGAKIHIIVPHYSTATAFSPQHYTYWTVGSWFTMDVSASNNTADECYSAFKCTLDSVRLNWLSHYAGISSKLYKIGLPFEIMANHFGLYWLQFAERWPFGWAEIEYQLTIKK